MTCESVAAFIINDPDIVNLNNADLRSPIVVRQPALCQDKQPLLVVQWRCLLLLLRTLDEYLLQ